MNDTAIFTVKFDTIAAVTCVKDSLFRQLARMLKYRWQTIQQKTKTQSF